MRALVCGVSGQDGAYLARLLVDKGYEVVGTSRDAQVATFENLTRLGIRDAVDVVSMSPTDFRSVLQVLSRTTPDELYNLSGQSSVGLSFEQPVETLESITIGTLNLLEAIRFLELPTKLYNASSGECFGETPPEGADENTAFQPRSPYAVAKATAHWLVKNYREAYGLWACSGVLFNHESPLRPARFVTQKIVTNACLIHRGEAEQLELGRVDIVRDWGWAPEYVDAMWRMLQQDEPDDFVIATGASHSLREFVDAVFSVLELDVEQHLCVSETLFRPSDIRFGRGNAAKAAQRLGWRAQHTMPDVARMMVDAYLADGPPAHVAHDVVRQ